VPTKFDHRVFVRIHHGYDEHPKVMPLTDAAFRAHIEAICWASRNEGRYRIPKTVACKKWRPKVIRELLDAVLFEDCGDTYEVHDYLDFNRSAEEIAAYREARGMPDRSATTCAGTSPAARSTRTANTARRTRDGIANASL
jgi:hypothetical protein